ncbi:MAG TPA: DUF6011 domain-containing protein [Acidimicrobiales bacterium]|nr:DUF6011 domain-containing protein [Acidimicrobiales bacterium]
MPFDPREAAVWAKVQMRRGPGYAAKSAAVLLADDAEDRRALGEALVAELDAAVRCRRCGRRLKDPVSVKLHIGPECRSKEAA